MSAAVLNQSPMAALAQLENIWPSAREGSGAPLHSTIVLLATWEFFPVPSLGNRGQ